jgi:hypothetical protein
MIAARIDASSTASSPIGVIPEPLSPFRWKGIVSAGRGYREYLVLPVAHLVIDLGTVTSEVDRPEVVALAEDAAVRDFLENFEFPVWNLRCGRADLYDLRYRFATLGNDWDPFGYSFAIHPSTPGIGVIVPAKRELLQRSFETLAKINWRALLAGSYVANQNGQSDEPC